MVRGDGTESQYTLLSSRRTGICDISNVQVWCWQHDGPSYTADMLEVERKRQELRLVAESTEMKKDLGKRRSATVAIRIVSSTKILDQFAGSRVASIEGDQGQLIWGPRAYGRR